MAVEQRIGRIHRYGQQETVQVYNLLAEDTVEERIYGLLDTKLADIARSIGKVDERGQTAEDFRSDILGLLGSRPDYQDLYKRALVDRDYRRTEVELAAMIEEANRAREALAVLSQDLTSFHLESYRKIEGHHTLAELGKWLRAMVLDLGGAVIPDGPFWTFHVPESLQRKYHLAPRYEGICFDRATALRARNCELGGIGHPLVDALVAEAKQSGFSGSVCSLPGTGEIVARYLVRYEDDSGKSRSRVLTFRGLAGQIPENQERFDWLTLAQADAERPTYVSRPVLVEELEKGFSRALQDYIIGWMPDRVRRARVETLLVGLHATSI